MKKEAGVKQKEEGEENFLAISKQWEALYKVAENKRYQQTVGVAQLSAFKIHAGQYPKKKRGRHMQKTEPVWGK